MAKDDLKTKLVVVQPFGDRQIGDTITAADEMASVLETHAAHVVKAAADDPAPPEGDPEPQAAPAVAAEPAPDPAATAKVRP